jgi:hypothetical protein
MITFGETDFQKLKMTGPYEVGYREFRTKKYGNEVSVFYPMERSEYKTKIG